jgi:lipopolysaccharide/colanic/teichoic acid biosynthesis glycosyltransferase
MKRVLDATGAALLLLAMAVPMVVLAILIAAIYGPPIFFKQRRPGLRGKPFELIKFRSMRACLTLVPDSQRLTPFGRFLRASSLDELPELWNVLRGDMSLVGPRPLLMEYLPLYSPEQARRHEVRPGITGWAQINGRNAISWEEKFKLDVWYVDNQSFLLDLKILLLTIIRVFQRSGISAEGEATMPKFTGARVAKQSV